MSSEEETQFHQNGASVKDMEAATVAWLADIHSVPFLSLKVVTDLIDNHERIENQFLKNFGIALENLKFQTSALLQHYRENNLA